MDLFTAVGRARTSLLADRAGNAHHAPEREAASIAETGCLRLQMIGAPGDSIAYLFAADQFTVVSRLLAGVGEPELLPPEMSVAGADVRDAEHVLAILAGDLASSLTMASRITADPALAMTCHQAAIAALAGAAAVTRSEHDAAHLR